jgi:hypothetical protein
LTIERSQDARPGSETWPTLLRWAVVGLAVVGVASVLLWRALG